MLEIVYGQTKRNQQARTLGETLNGPDATGTLYIGYPVIASADDMISVDALLVSDRNGLVIFTLGEEVPAPHDNDGWDAVRAAQDRLYFAISTSLGRHEGLRRGRELGIEIHVVTVYPALNGVQSNDDAVLVADLETVGGVIGNFRPIEAEFRKPLNAALQRVTTIRPAKKRTSVVRPESKGAVLKKIEAEIANLDQWQKRAAIESPEGPQRIRGLAGSGKTVVLALKAAYLHAKHPDWIIAVTYHTRSLRQQIRDLIRRFSFEHISDEPNWNNLRVMAAWGGNEQGLYAEIAEQCAVVPRDFLYGKNQYGMNDAFGGVCDELVAISAKTSVDPIYDAVLIDEAQDLPVPFFRLVHKFSKPPHRIIWAYDELQNLSEGAMPSVLELFGKDSDGRPLVELTNPQDGPRQDLMLPVCYRNTQWALTLAHALGFGIYRAEGIVQHFDDPTLWTEIGYQVVNGDLEAGREVSLERNPTSYPTYFAELMTHNDAVASIQFANEIEQAEWVADNVKTNLTVDELDADDILIVLPDAFTSKKKALLITEALSRRGIESHLAGVTTSRDQIFKAESVAIAHIFRSKGNEAPMVYVLNAQFCVAGHELLTLRNTLFTAITRSKGWVRICGWGAGMERLLAEINQVRRNNFRLQFTVPSVEQLAQLRMIHRDRTAHEKARIRKAEQGLKSFVEALERGDLVLENLPLELRTSIGKYFMRDGDVESENDA